MQKSLNINWFEEYRKEQTIKNADGLIYSVISVIISLLSFVTYLYMQYVVFENQFGVVCTVILALITFIVPGTVFNYIKKNNRDTFKRHIVLSVVKLVCTLVYAYIYYIVLKAYIPANILFYTLVGTSVVSYIFYIFLRYDLFENASSHRASASVASANKKYIHCSKITPLRFCIEPSLTNISVGY